MALFQRKPTQDLRTPSYTVTAQKTVLVVGLGNVGKKYDLTRHNIGFYIIDDYARKNEFPQWQEKKDFQCEITQTTLGSTQAILIKPSTMMNLSGEAVQAVAHFYKIKAENIFAIYDELDIPFGQLRSRVGGSSGGHNGVKSLITHIGEDFKRIRVGIGPKQPKEMESADFVLAKLSTEQQKSLPLISTEAQDMLQQGMFGSFMSETRSVV